MSGEVSHEEGGVEIPQAEQAEIAARLDAFATNAQEIKSGLMNVNSVEGVLAVVNGAVESAPNVMMSMKEKRMVSLSENGDPSAKMVEYDSMLVALNDLRQKEEAVLANENEYGYVEVSLDDYREEVPGYILDRIAQLPRFHLPQ
tara:strand:- start:3546 stop:3980 length:435 start_codon:yes stop_codon:yes gene_type:complete